MNLLESFLSREGEFQGILQRTGELVHHASVHPLLVTGLTEGAREAYYGAMVPQLVRNFGKSALILLPDEKEVLKLSGVLEEAGLSVLQYPLRDLQFYSVVTSHEFEHERLAVLSALIEDRVDVVLTTPDAALQYTVPPAVLCSLSFSVNAGMQIEPQTLVHRLLSSGYFRAEQTDGVGQFSHRGGIVDFFPPSSAQPIRIEFFGDEIDRICTYDPLTQRRVETVESVTVSPAREIAADEEARKKITSLAQRCAAKATPENKIRIAAELEALQSGTELLFLDKYLSVLYETPACLLSYFSDCAHPVFEQDAGACRERVEAFEFRMKEASVSLCEEAALPGKYAVFNFWQTDLDVFLGGRTAQLIETFTTGNMPRLGGTFHFSARQTVGYADQYDLLLEDLIQYNRAGYKTVLLCESEIQAKTVRQKLFDDKIPTASAAPDTDPDTLREGVPAVVSRLDAPGFDLPNTRFAALSLTAAHSAYARALQKRSLRRHKKRSAAERIASYADLEIGDYIVHENHGIGRYEGIRSITDVDGNTRDFITIRYEGTDNLFIPCDQLDSVSKYIGPHAEDGTVRLSRMGGAEWKRTTARVRAATKEMAKELIALYAARQHLPGFAFDPDSPMQEDFENTFPFEETEGQLIAAAEIKRDMEKPVPMDRLLCGDVGYGKTEVALRAAFKAVLSGKQAALLAPTTILAMQHYQTILQRMRGFPVTVEVLSRFRTPARQAEILRRLRRGEIDILVGTHRLLSKDVVFRDLGLVIIDEEQRFGVSHKEKLKQMCKNVDALTLTATPIPRTLHMAMSGIRDMSVLEEAPFDRVPVQTYVLEYDPVVLAEALRRELRRGGQVFWLHNRVEDIDAVAARVSAAVPDARVVTAHGKMEKEQLSDIWQAMTEGEIDVLISTTIIETGIDVPNANTLIIENADRMGLAQLHQIRGRVGRSSRRAYAYLTWPKGKVLSEIATKRLSAIREFTEFGAGFKIAMRDLELRGAGDVLGAAQHGHLESVGYDLYMKLLNEAIAEERGEPVKQRAECTVQFKCDAYLPQSYIRSAAQRIDAYRKIASVETAEDAADIADELTDRYGKIPRPCKNLITVASLRSRAREHGFTRIEERDGSIVFFAAELDFAAWARVSNEVNGDRAGRSKVYISMGKLPCITYRPHRTDVLDAAAELFDRYEAALGTSQEA